MHDSESKEADITIKIQTPGVHHVTLRVSDYERARRFYIETLGFEVALEAPNLVIFITSPPCTLRIIDRFKVNAEGEIVEQENFFDPRDMTNPGWRSR